MTYVINHVQMLQQLESDGETRAFQIDRNLNPADVLATWRDSATRARHYALLMGNPVKARQLWLASSAYKQWRPAKLVSVPTPPPEVTFPDKPDGDTKVRSTFANKRKTADAGEAKVRFAADGSTAAAPSESEA